MEDNKNRPYPVSKKTFELLSNNGRVRYSRMHKGVKIYSVTNPVNFADFEICISPDLDTVITLSTIVKTALGTIEYTKKISPEINSDKYPFNTITSEKSDFKIIPSGHDFL